MSTGRLFVYCMSALRLPGKQFSVYSVYCPKTAGDGLQHVVTLVRVSGSDNGQMDGWMYIGPSSFRKKNYNKFPE